MNIKIASELSIGDLIRPFNTQLQSVLDVSITSDGLIEVICEEQAFILKPDLQIMVFE